MSSVALADDICPDRPAKSAEPCTVSQGQFQIESDFTNITIQNQVITTVISDPTLKYGVAPNVNAEITVSPITIVNSKGVHNVEGFGDTLASLKFEMVNNPKWQFALSPYIKLPTAEHHIGNGKIEGGITAPSQWVLNDTWSITIVPVLDIFKDDSDNGYHINTSNVFSVNTNLPHKLSSTVEIWTDYNFDPVRPTKQYTLDLALAWTPKSDLEWDISWDIGLNKQAPSNQIAIGFAKRF